MASSLATQLAQVRSYNADRLSGSKSAERAKAASYLFPADIAATQDYYMLHGLARNGWEGLCASDAAFHKWGQSTGYSRLLFGDASRDLDRLTRTKEENQHLDRAIQAFFAMVSDSLLDRSSAKCIEWLVRRFRVHQYNVEDCLTLFIPYHETNEFIRMLKILDLDNKPHLSFLLPAQKRGVQLPSSALISAVISHPSTTPSLATLRWLLGTYNARSRSTAFARPRTVARMFWLSVIVKICALWSGEAPESHRMGISKATTKRRNTREDDAQLILSVMLPSVVTLLTNENSSSDDCIVSCMALSSIAGAFDLSAEAARGLLSCLANVRPSVENARIATFTTCAALCSRHDVTLDATRPELGLDDQVIDHEVALKLAQLCSQAPAALRQASNLCAMDAFSLHLAFACTAFIGRASAVAGSESANRTIIFDALDIILNNIGIERQSQAAAIISLMIQNSPDDNLDDMTRVLAPLRQRHPIMFDKAVKLVQGSEKHAHDQKLWMIMTGNAKQSAAVNHTHIVLGASDSSAETRVMALQKVFAGVTAGDIQPRDNYAKQIVSNALLDEDIAVLETVYASKDALMAIYSAKDILDIITQAFGSQMAAETNSNVIQVHLAFVLDHLFISSQVANADKSIIWQKFLLPQFQCKKGNTHTHKKFYDALLRVQSHLKTSHWPDKALQAIAQVAKKPIQEEDWVRVNVVVVDALSKSISDCDDTDLFDRECSFLQHMTFDNELVRSEKSDLRAWAVYTLANVVARCSVDRKSRLVSQVLDNLRSEDIEFVGMNESFFNTGTAIPDVLASALYKRPGVPSTYLEAKTFLAHAISTNIPIERSAVLAPPSAELIHAQKLFSLFVQAANAGSQSGTELSIKLLKRYGESALVFLASIWTDTTSMEHLVRTTALAFASSFCSAFLADSTEIRALDFQTIVPSLLIALKDDDKRIRLEAMRCVDVVSQITNTFENTSRKGKGVQIYAYDALYGKSSSEHLRYLETSTLARLLQALGEQRASFVNDALYLNTFLAAQCTTRKEEGKKEAAYKVSVLQFLLSHIVCWTVPSLQTCLLETVAGVSHASKLEVLLPLLVSINNDAVQQYPRDLVRMAFAAFDKSSKRLVDTNENDCWTLFIDALERGAEEVQISASLALSGGLFSALSSPKQREILMRVASLVATSTTALPRDMRLLLSSLPYSTDILVQVLAELRGQVSGQNKTATPAKRHRGQSSSNADPNSSAAVLAEIMESLLARKQQAQTALMAELFEILRISSEMFYARLGTAEYLMQLSMSNLARIFDATSRESTDRLGDILRLDTLVNIIKMPCRPQTFQQALLLMSSLGRLAPELILHHSMPIFTFVGTSMLQRDDDYSFAVIAKTLQSILPAVAADSKNRIASRQQTRFELLQSSRTLLCVFTDAATHVPRHRRGAFFQLVTKALGLEDYLGAICMLLVDRQAAKIARMEEMPQIRDALQLPLLLYQSSEGHVDGQLSALDDTWQEIERTWSHRQEDPIEMQDHVFLDCVRGLEKEHDHGKVEPIRRISALLSFTALAASSSRASFEEERSDEGAQQRAQRDGVLRSIIERALTLSRDSDSNLSLAAQRALDATLSLVTLTTLESVVSSLISSTSAEQCRIGLSVANKALGEMGPEERRRASSFTPRVVNLCQEMLANDMLSVDDVRLALETIKTAAADSSTNEHSSLAKAVPALCKLASAGDSRTRLLALSVLLSLSKILGPRLIPILGAIIRTSLKIIAGTDSSDTSTAAASMDVLSAVVKSVPTFVSAHLSSLFLTHVENETLLEQSSSRRLLSTIVNSIAPGDVLQSVYKFYDDTDKQQARLPLFCLNIVQRCLKVLDRKRTQMHYKGIFRFILQLLDSRRLHVLGAEQAKHLSSNDIDTIEGECVETFSRLVLKLNESTFRPLFLRLCDWAMLELLEDAADGGEGTRQSRLESQARQSSLFKTLNSLLSQLGELIVHYYANVLDGATEALHAMSQDNVNEDSLWSPLVQSLSASARVDKGAFWNEGRVNKVLPALAAQLTTPLVHGSSAAEQALGDAISSLCQTVTSESCLKEANNRLLAHARDASSATSSGGYSAPATHRQHIPAHQRTNMRTRVAAIRTMERLWSTPGCDDALLSLVPETVPSVAELLQETDQSVQEAMMALVAAIEAILGESLDAYLQ